MPWKKLLIDAGLELGKQFIDSEAEKHGGYGKAATHWIQEGKKLVQSVTDDDQDFDSENVNSEFDEWFESYTDGICERIRIAKELEIQSDNFENIVKSARDDAYDACSEMLKRNNSEDYEHEINILDALSDECGNLIFSKCRGSMDHLIDVAKSDLQKNFEFQVFGCHPTGIFREEGSSFIYGLIKKGRISKGEILTFDNGESSEVACIKMFGTSHDFAEAGDVAALFTPNIHADSVLRGMIGVCANGTAKTEEKEIAVSDVDAEKDYLNEVKSCLEDSGEISDRERRLLDRLRKSLGITEERAAELEAMAQASEYSDEEREYLEEIKACLADDGVITDRERRLLDRLRKSLGITEERAAELEAMAQASDFSDEEREYLEEIKACLADEGKITDRERRLLDRLRKSLGITEERAAELVSWQIDNLFFSNGDLA